MSRKQFNYEEHIGERYGRLVILSYDKERSEEYNEKHQGKDYDNFFFCRCDCGNEKSISYRNLRRGQTKSCGCYRNELTQRLNRTPDKEYKKFIEAYSSSNIPKKVPEKASSINFGRRYDFNKKHGQYKTRLYNIWSHMKSRCNNPNYDAYKYYGARGIKVCDEWNNNFEAFWKWAEKNGYADDLTIDRINNDGNYEPSNCRWTSYYIQMRNNRKNVYITYTLDFRNIGKEIEYIILIVEDWLKILKISHATFRKYLTYERGDMTINEVIEFCYALGHGLGTQKIMYFDPSIACRSNLNYLKNSIRDEVINPNRPQSIKSKELLESLAGRSTLQVMRESKMEKRFGRLTTIGKVFQINGRNYIHCRCECGKELSVRYDHLISGNTKSCGCLQKDKTHDILIKRNTTHGDTHTRLYHMWQKLKVRAKKAGVSLYEKWAKSYEEFKEWAEDNEYNDSLFVERIDENHGFYPYNCQLVDYHTLQIKKEGNVYLSLEIDGKMYTFIAKDWESITGIKAGTIKYRIYNLDKTHMSIKELLTTNIDGSSIDIKVPKEMLKYNLPEKYEVSYHD